MKNAKFKIAGKLDSAGGYCEGTCVIERATGVVQIRRSRARRVFLTTLSAMCDTAVQRQIMQEVRERKAAKKKSRRGR